MRHKPALVGGVPELRLPVRLGGRPLDDLHAVRPRPPGHAIEVPTDAAVLDVLSAAALPVHRLRRFVRGYR